MSDQTTPSQSEGTSEDDEDVYSNNEEERTEVDPEESIFELSMRNEHVDPSCDGVSGEGGVEWAEGSWEARRSQEEEDELTELPLQGNSDSPDDYIVYGTTPPRHGRYEKMANKSHKHKTTKKLSPGPMSLKPKTGHRGPKTDSSKQTPNPGGASQDSNLLRQAFAKQKSVSTWSGKVSSLKREKKGKTATKFPSPTHHGGGEEEDSKLTKRKRKQQRKRDRDSKSSLNQQRLIPSPKLLHSQSIDVTDYGRPPRSSFHLSPYSVDDDYLTASLQPHLLQSWKGSANSLIGESSRVRRVQSDFSLSTQISEERQYCAPERKQFYRKFLNALKHSGISNVARPLMESTPMSGIHVARMRSENLTLDNPFGDVWERIWLELKSYLSDRTPESYKEWMFFKETYVDQILRRVIDFKMPYLDPIQSLNSAFFGIDDVEPLRSVSGRSDYSGQRCSSKRVGFTQPLATSEATPSSAQERDDKTFDEPDGLEEQSISAVRCDLFCQQDSSSSGDSEPVSYEPREFLSQLHMAALRRVCTLLKEVEEAESLFSNRGKMGDEHPNYRTLNFRRRMGALILWFKVTSNLAAKLCNLSKWLGVRVELRDVCTDVSFAPSQSSNEEGKSHFPLERQGCVELSSILVTSGSPRSPTKPHAHFSFGSHSSEEEASFHQQVSYVSNAQSSNSSATLQRLFSNYQSVLESNGPYREFVNRSLKRKGLTYLMKALLDYIKPVLRLAQYALCPPSEPSEESDEPSESHDRPLLQRFLNPALFGSVPREESPVQFERSTSTGPENWIQEFELMNLPLFTMQYIRLVHVPLDVMHECLKLQLELKPPQQPSMHSVRQLVRECRETLEQAIEIRKFYREKIELVTRDNPSKLNQVESDIEEFEADLKSVLEVYFDYLQSWVQVSSGHILEEEWRHVKNICTHIRGGEAEAGRRFCDMASRLLESTGDILETRMDECCRILHKSSENAEQRRVAIGDSCRSFKELFVEIRERSSKALGFAKMLRKDLEIAADFSIQVPTPQLLQTLQASDHVQVKVSDQKLDKMMFVTEPTSSTPNEIHQLLNVSFAHGGGPEKHFDPSDSYLLLVNLDVASSQSSWNGKTVDIHASAETTIAISEIQVESLKMIVSSSANLSTCRNSFLNAVGSAVRLTNEQTSSHENVAERIVDLKKSACGLGSHLMRTALQVMEHLGIEDTPNTDDLSKPYQATMHSCFNLGFEYVREVFRLLGDDMAYSNLGEQALEYAVLWIRFVLDKCDRGRGTRPRWASTGLEFMTVACAPRTLATISQTKFEALKKLMDRCVDHVVGEAPLPIITQEDHSVRSAVRNRKPWRKPPRPPFGTRAFSDSSSLAVISQTEEEDDLLRENAPHNLLEVSQTPVDIEKGIIRVDRAQMEAAVDKLRVDDTPLPAGLLYSLPPSNADHLSVHPYLPGVSPPVSTESIDSVDHSSGVDSPLHHSGDITNTTVSSGYNPMATPKRPSSFSFTHQLDRTDSSTSTASASRYYTSSVSLNRSDSGLSLGETERTKRIREEVRLIEQNREVKLHREKIIGHVRKQEATSRPDDKLSIIKQANFKWQRGRKLGEGRFGKVYECLNLTSGETNAVKQISIQEKDSSSIQTILDEINVFQRLQHDNIVKFFGVEIHHNELYMFMEYCNEGTLWSIAQQGLTENMTRHYTRDIVRAIYFLHDNGIVHRDIKGSNIFLSSDGSIKLGDFGLSVQLKNYHKTMPNEIKQQVGTVPYMSPEVILKQSMGRPMDIWSIGCVLVEMATGKLPWSEFENQFQIMYQLGSGKSPHIPENALSGEGRNFLDKCFIRDPQVRWRAIQLLDHPFVKVGDGDTSTDEG